ncbi:hypothetical protein [Streptomyces sp. ODS28]|uniref:hypothetical protein n=1 Tax=Streptomyces sp. ODS28 TaxID=3136688 RepID=UPI0031F12FF3
MTIEHVAAHRTVVLDGCDGAGKSTFATVLVDRHRFAAVHSPRTPDHQDVMSRYRDLLARPGRLVLDRCFLSELVYGPLYRGHSRLSWSQVLDLAQLVEYRGGIFLHVTAPSTTLRHRLQLRDGRAPGMHEITELYRAYQRAFATLSHYAPVLTYDTSTRPLSTGG